MKIILASNGSFLIKEGFNLISIPVDKIKIGNEIKLNYINNEIRDTKIF